MGVDYDGVGGIGIELTDKIISNLIESGRFTEDDWDDDANSCFEELGITFGRAGSAYSGNYRQYLFVDGENLDEINANAQDFINRVGKLGIELTTKDLLVIEDLYVW